MGREPYPLEKGGRFLRTLIFKFDEDVSTPSSLKDPKPINAELMERLSPDFLSVGARTSNAVKREIEASDRRTRFWQVFLPAIFALVASSLTLWYSNNSLSKEFTQRISDLEKVKVEGRLLALEKDFPTEKRLNVIEERLRQMETRPGSQVK